MIPLKLPVDVLCGVVASDEEATRKAELFFGTEAGVNLQALHEEGVLGEVDYRNRFNQLFGEFLNELSSKSAT